MFLESKVLLSNNLFHTIRVLMLFSKSDCHKISFFDDGGLKLSHFDIFDMPFPFLAFVKL